VSEWVSNDNQQHNNTYTTTTQQQQQALKNNFKSLDFCAALLGSLRFILRFGKPNFHINKLHANLYYLFVIINFVELTFHIKSCHHGIMGSWDHGHHGTHNVALHLPLSPSLYSTLPLPRALPHFLAWIFRTCVIQFYC
jgi:hypothetical protein